MILVVTMTCNRVDTTKRWLPTLRQQSHIDYKHIVVDNGSTDGTVAWLRNNGYEVLKNTSNVGIARAWQQAYDYIDDDPDVIVKFDDDCEILTDGLLGKLCNWVMNNPGYVAAPHNVTLDDNPAYYPRKTGPEQQVGGRLVQPVIHVGGLMIAVPQAAWPVISGMPQDNMRGQALRQAGYQPVYVEDLFVAHHGTERSIYVY